ncbi:MAG: hypothetical protein ABIN61_06985 [candidate division WOR-3 bacterium]
MKFFKYLLLLSLLFSFEVISCRKNTQKEESFTFIEKEEFKDLLLNEKEVKSFIKAFPVAKRIMKEKEESLEDLFSNKTILLKISNLEKNLLKELDKALRKYGFTGESFFKTSYKILGCFTYMQIEESQKENIKNMEKLLDNPNISKRQKAEIEKDLKELKGLEETDEMKAHKENWKILGKYKEEISKLFSSAS